MGGSHISTYVVPTYVAPRVTAQHLFARENGRFCAVHSIRGSWAMAEF